MKVLLPLTLLAFFTLGCSHRPAKVTLSDLSPDQLEQLNEQALAIASQRLDSMVSHAQNNPEAKQFLASDLFLKANMSLMEGDFTTASVLFTHVSNLVPEDEFILKKLSVSLIRMGDLETAKGVLQKLYSKSKDEKVGMILAGVYTGLDQEPEAQKLYGKLLAINPKNEDACIFLSKSYAVNKKIKEATAQLESCSKKDPKNGIYDYYLGKVQIDLGNLNKALTYFERSYKKQPGLNQAVSALGIIYEEREQFETAIKLYKKYLATSPNDSQVLNRLVQTLFVKEKYAEVIPYAEKLSDLEPDNLNLKVKLGVLYTDAKKYSEAISIFKDLLSAAPESDRILYYLGAIYQETKEYQSSIEYFNQIKETSSLYADSSVQMANMLSMLAQQEFYSKDTEQWAKTFKSHIENKLSKIEELKVESSVVLTGYYESIGDYKSAVKSLGAVQDEKNFSLEHKYYLANLYEKEMRYEDSTKLIQGIIESEPKNAHAWNFLGYAMLLRGNDLEQAFTYISKAVELSPDDGYIRDSLGWYYFKKGNIKKAKAELEFALSKVPNDVEILKHLAAVHKELKNYEKARAYLETALQYVRLPLEKNDILVSIEKIETERSPASAQID